MQSFAYVCSHSLTPLRPGPPSWTYWRVVGNNAIPTANIPKRLSRCCAFWRCCPQGESRNLDSCTRLYDATVKIVTDVLGQEMGAAPASG